jgi:hypothetical protein
MDAIIVGTPFDEETRTTPEASNAPISGCRQKKPRDERTSVDDESDGIICRRGGHGGIDARRIVRGRAACEFVTPIS